MIVKELVTKLGFEADEKALDRWDAGIESLIGGLQLVVAVAAAAGAALSAFTAEATEYAGELLTQSKITGFAVEELQQLKYAASQSEVAVEDLDAALGFLTKTMGAALNGDKAAIEAYAELGVKIRDASGAARSGKDVLLDVAERLAAIEDPAKRAAYAVKIFGRGGMAVVPFLAQGRVEIEKLIAKFDELGITLTKEQVDALDEYGDQLDEVKLIFRGLRMQLGAEFMPVLKELVTEFHDWYLANKEIIKQRLHVTLELTLAVLRPIGKVLGVVVDAFGLIAERLPSVNKTLRVFNELLEVTAYALGAVAAAWALFKIAGVIHLFTSWAGLLVLINGLLAGVSAALVFITGLISSTMLIVGLLAVAFGLLLQDIRVWQEGGESLIGKFLGSWAEFLDGIEAGVEMVKGFWDNLALSTQVLVVVMKQLWMGFKDWLTGWWDAFMTGLLDQIDRVVEGARRAAAFFGISSSAQASATAPGNVTNTGGGGSRTYAPSQRNSLQFNVPPGTTQQQTDYMTEMMKNALGEAWAPVAEAYPELEYGN